MKTTIELSDQLLIQAKVVAAQRQTTLRAIFEHALRREIGEVGGESDPSPYYSIGAGGLPNIKHRGRKRVTSAMVRELGEED